MLTIVFFASKQAKEPVTEVIGVDGSLVECIYRMWQATGSPEFVELMLGCFHEAGYDKWRIVS